MSSSWRVALRIARRDTRRAYGRSALVVAMIALPVLGVTAIDVLARTGQLSTGQQADRALGRADLALTDTGLTGIEQLDGTGSYNGGQVPRLPTDLPTDLRAGLPAGSRVLTDRSSSGRAVSVPGTSVRSNLRELAYADPLAHGLYRQVEGRAPSGPGEVSLTTALARRLGVAVGDRVGLPVPDPTATATVVGTVADGSDRATTTALLAAGALDADPGAQLRLLVGLPAPPTWDLVRRLNAAGVQAQTRGERLPGQPAPETAIEGGGGTLTGVVLVVGMALLEVVLLAGPAFAVGAKRQEHVLALLSAAGAERRDVRRTVLAAGLVLGVVGAVAGALDGVALARGLLPVAARFDSTVPGPFDVRPLEVLAIAAVGVGTALAAALLPAFLAARQDVLAALTGRRGTRRTPVALPLAGLAVAAGGTLLALHGARSRSVNVILAGAALAELGLVATTPALVALAGRLGPLLPAAPRLALRDAARNRARTAPAVSAILAAVAGSVAVGTYVSSLDRNDHDTYRPGAPLGTVSVGLYGDETKRADQVVAAFARELPGVGAAVVRVAGGDGTVDTGYIELVRPAANRCPPSPAAADPRCADAGGRFGGQLVVGGADVLAALTGAGSPALDKALAAGTAVVPALDLEPGATASFRVHPPSVAGSSQPGAEDSGRLVRLPAVALPATAAQPQTVLPAAAAAALGGPVSVVGVVARPAQPPTSGQEDRLRSAVTALGVEPAQLDVERGYVSHYGIGLLALLAGSALLVLGASGIATGLAAADGRADLSTLAAVGASPGLRRLLAASQSVVTALLGSLLGVAAGLVPAIGLIRAVNAPDVTGYQRPVPLPLVIPWGSIAVSAVVVPLVAGAAAAILTRSRLPLVRRVA